MIELKKIMNMKDLQKLQDQFSDATGLAAIAVDATGNYVTEGSNFTDFCMKYTRGSQEGAKRCMKCDNECTGTYYCHAGLMDFSSDILINGEKVGAIIGGQVLPNAPDEEKFRRIAQELQVDEEQYIKALRKVPVLSEKTIRAAAAMLGDMVNQLVNLKFLESNNRQKVQSFDEEMDSVLNGIGIIMQRTKDLQRVASMEQILSLNASVEAARAGAAGVGFAVVAKEIGDLSGNSSNLYNEIQDVAVALKQSVQKMNQISFK